ncbi:recombinase family protein [Euryarchaeota archaeon]|nr:recombinase family protein [Euryarchaeota archaeon]
MLSERAAAYVRVSSQRQADEGVSIDAQIRRIKQYAQFKVLTLKDEDIFIDRGVSGGIPIWLRPQGGALHRKLLQEGIPHLISMKIDRMFRIVSDALITVDELSSEGTTLHIVDLHGEPVDTSSATGRFFLTILAAMAEMERGLISERTKMGMDSLEENSREYNLMTTITLVLSCKK